MIDEVVIRCSPAQLKIIQLSLADVVDDFDMCSHLFPEDQSQENKRTLKQLMALLNKVEQTQVFTH